MDSPVELSDFALRQWTVSTLAGNFPVRLALHHQGTDAELDAYVEMLKKVVQQEIAVFGVTPRYDVGSYTFIADYLPWASGDGMEHRNSTIITSSRPLSTSAMGLLGTASHEYFHSWNVERIRPKVAGAVRLHAGQHVGGALVRGGVHQLLRAALPPPRRDHHAVRTTRTTSRAASTPSSTTRAASSRARSR